MNVLNVADLFCGGGGFSEGAEQTKAAKLVFALNHWKPAIATHSANFPHAQHVNSKLSSTKPGECLKRVHLLLASPECTFHSNARGGLPMQDQSRAQARDVLAWVDYHRPDFMVIENVREFTRWGELNKRTMRPLKSRKGKLFQQWVKDLQGLGYAVEWRLLNSADYGAGTSRIRLFVIARKVIKRNARITWPEPTHSVDGSGNLPTWHGAHEFIDWAKPCPSIFTREKPLVVNSLRRVSIGLRKFCQDGDPALVHYRNNCDARDLEDPLPTITAGGRHSGIMIPIQCQSTGRGVGRMKDVLEPMPTIIACRKTHGLLAAYLVDTAHGNDTHRIQENVRRVRRIDDPAATMTSKRSWSVCVPVLTQYYGTGHADSVIEPLATITTKTRHALAMYRSDGINTPNWSNIDWADSPELAALLSGMRDLGFCDIGFRMLENDELALAQGFPATYIWKGGISQVTKQIGNSVSPPVAEAIVKVLVS